MPNQLALPLKSTSPISLRSALQEYIQSAHPETHPDAFKWDIKTWETMRREAVSSPVHIDSVRKYITYHAQLVLIATKLPADINLPIPYTYLFSPNSPPLLLSNLVYERVNILFNLAALFCQLATLEDRTNGDGIKRAVAHFQHAAGVLSHIISVLPSLETSLPQNTALPADTSEPFLKALALLMLAQAQECFWQRAVMDIMKNILIAKLSSKTSSFYKKALDAMEADPTASAVFPREWIAHVRTKHHHFAAAALYRKSVDDIETHRYGEELARLGMAKVEAKKAMDAARRGGVARTVQDDTMSLLQTLETSFSRAERDNDLIYHQDVTVPSLLPPIPDIKDMVMSVVPPGLKDPGIIIQGGQGIFGDLSGWGVKVAIDIYREKLSDWVQREVVDRAKKLDSLYTAKLAQFNLPAALDALDRPITLPPSLLGKAEEVRLEDGTHCIPALIEDVKKLARCDSAVLDEALDILDQEATEDEELREAHKVDVSARPVSHEANKELTDQARRYHDVLDHAAKSNRAVQDMWAEWAEKISILCQDETDLERFVPSSTMSSADEGGNKSTLAHARALRAHLESLDDLRCARTEVVRRAQRLMEMDDIAPRLRREAAVLGRWVEVRPEVFDNALEEELGKYERFQEELEESERRQDEGLRGIGDHNALFLDSRREDSSVKARERALQSLDLAYHKYREIHGNLTDGIKFYNDFASVLGQFKEHCKVWVFHRRKDVEWLLRSLNAMHLSQSPSRFNGEAEAVAIPCSTTHVDNMKPGPQPVPPEPGLDFEDELPPPDSDDWQSAEVDDFSLHLPPPDSADWEAIDTFASAIVRQPQKARAARRPVF